MNGIPKQLIDLAEQVRRGEQTEPVSARQLLKWFQAERRGYWIVKEVHKALRKVGLTTVPDFEANYIDAPFLFSVIERPSKPRRPLMELAIPFAPAAEDQEVAQAPSLLVGGAIEDPTYRIGKLESANRAPLSIAPHSEVTEAATLMLSHEYSQLPVMINDRTVKGVVSWASIGSRLAFNQPAKYVRQCMDPAQEISADRSIFRAIPMIAQADYVLVRSPDGKISGIVTAYDLGLQFQQLAEPFLLIGEVENHVRRLIDGKFTLAEIGTVRNPADTARQVVRVSDLSFGEYVRLLEEPARWSKMRLTVDRKIFLDNLQKVHAIRNDVMHFDPDGLPEEDLLVLRRVVRFLQQLREIGAG